MKHLMKQSIYILMTILTVHASFPLEACQRNDENIELIGYHADPDKDEFRPIIRQSIAAQPPQGANGTQSNDADNVLITDALRELSTGTSFDQGQINEPSQGANLAKPKNGAIIIQIPDEEGGAGPEQTNKRIQSNDEEIIEIDIRGDAQQDPNAQLKLMNEQIQVLIEQIQGLKEAVQGQQIADIAQANQVNSNQEVRDRVFWAWKLWICGENFFNITGRIAWVMVITFTSLSKWTLIPAEIREALGLAGFLASAYVGISLLLGGYAGRLRHKKGAVVKARKPSGGVIQSAQPQTK